MNEAYRVRARI